MKILSNVICYQAGWLCAVLGAAHEAPWAGVAAMTIVIGVHLAAATRPRAELQLILAAVAAGIVVETVLALTGWIRYPNDVAAHGMAPAWIVALWAMFATTLNVSLRGLRDKPWTATLLAAIGAPLAYRAGAALGALELTDAGVALAAIAVAWACATPLLLGAARRHDGFGAA